VLSCAPGELAGTLLDISYQGTLFESVAPLRVVGDRCSLVIPFGRDPEEAIRLDAAVVFQDGGRLGLYWGEVGAETAMKLRRLLELTLGMPTLLDAPVRALIWPALPRPRGAGRADLAVERRAAARERGR
jgi:hypothetical protein